MKTQAQFKLKVQAHELQIVLDLLREIVPEYEVRAFGSRVSGNPKPFSDLDLALLGPEALPISTRADLQHAFTESDLPWKVDLVDWQSISPEFQNIIQANFETLQTPASSKPSK